MTPDGTKAYVTDRVEGEVLGDRHDDERIRRVSDRSRRRTADVAVSPDSPRAYVTNSADGTVINTTADTVSNTISVGGTPYGIAFERNGEEAYVTDFAGDQVTVIDTETETADPVKIPVGGAPMRPRQPGGGRGLHRQRQRNRFDRFGDRHAHRRSRSGKNRRGSNTPSRSPYPDGASVFTATGAPGTTRRSNAATRETVGSPTEVGKYPYGIAVFAGWYPRLRHSSEDDSVSVIDIEPPVSSTVVSSALGSGPVASGVSSGPPIEVGSYPTGIAFTTVPGREKVDRLKENRRKKAGNPPKAAAARRAAARAVRPRPAPRRAPAAR